MKIATWNVNSVRSRIEHLTDWLGTAQPDVVLLQETKAENINFPQEPIEDLGYNIAIQGQKSYNGVAILSKHPIDDVITALPGEEDRPEARYIEAVTNQVRVASVYIPNGQEVGHEKYQYKLRFFENLYQHMKALRLYEEKVVIGGDYNVAPEGRDTYDPEKFQNRILVSDQERAAYRKLCNLGYTDALRAFKGTSAADDLYTWWDYRQGSWAQNRGLRIDHFLLSPEATDVLANCEVDLAPRGRQRPSDHTPVIVTLA